MADDDYYECDWRGCYSSRWNSWGRWVFLAFVIIGFLLLTALCLTLSARRRRRAGRQPFLGTAWLAPQKNYPQPYPGPPGPAGYFPPGAAQQEPPVHMGNYYTPPPYSPHPHPQETGVGYTPTGTTDSNAYYAPPSHPPPAQVAVNNTGTSTTSYVQSNNPWNTNGMGSPVPAPAQPAPAHVDGKN